MQVINVQDLTKYYGKNLGIEDVNFSVDEGEIFGFIGPNGAGKSTTIRTLLNFIYPTRGTATVFDKDIIKDTKEIRKEIGYLPAEISYYDDMRAKDLLNYSARFYEKDCTNRMNDLASKLELELDKKVENLSSGNKKKLGIVQALLHHPKLLILDEPTSGLDPLVQKTFFELLREERKKGVTVFFSSHILGEVQKLCDRVAIIREGTIIKVERIEDLIKNQFRNVTIVLDENTDFELNLDGIIKQEKTANTIKFLYNGNSKELIKKLKDLQFNDLLIEEPSLEEVFMHYYEKD